MSHNPDKRPVIAVLGAGTGIGEAVSRKFVVEGFVVALIARTEDKLKEMKDGIWKTYGDNTAQYYVTDLRDEKQVIDSFNKIKEQLGIVDVLVYNAGARRVNGREILNTGSDEFESFTKINLFGAFYATKCVLPDMIERHRGTILYTGATGSVRGSPGLSSFSPGKFGLRSLAQIVTREYQDKGIHAAHIIIDSPVDGVLIGGVRRRQWQREGKGDKLSDIESHLLQPKDLADLYWFLHKQPKSTWTHELDVRPEKEGMFSKL